MKYPSISRSKAQELATAHLGAPSIQLDDDIIWEGDGPEMDLGPIAELAASLHDSWTQLCEEETSPDRDLFEGHVGAQLHKVLTDAGLPWSALDDPGLWRYLTLAHLWWFVKWRQERTFASEDWGKYRKYVDGTNPTECVVLRAFLRGQLTEPTYELATAIHDGTDFWRSHVIRVRTGSSPTLARAFAAEQRDHRMATSELRPFARRLNRVWTNVILHTYEDMEAASLITELREPQVET